jgi:hypothetical protein
MKTLAMENLVDGLFESGNLQVHPYSPFYNFRYSDAPNFSFK